VNDPSAVYATAEDVSYILEVVKTHFPDSSLTSDQVRSTWAGLRPLMCPVEASSDDVDESTVSREHQIVVGQDGLVTIAGGKLTTYRRMAAEVVDTVIKLLRLSDSMPPGLDASRTDEEPLPGAVGWPADDDRSKVADRARSLSEGRLSLESAMLLTDTYGMSALDVARLLAADPLLAEPIVSGRPELMAQVDWAVRMELANEVSDVLMRRTQLFFRDRDQGLSGVERVGAYMAEMLGWSPERREQSEQAYRQEVALSRGWRD
jgi:glycerol-3-phosphate dehydrogenase